MALRVRELSLAYPLRNLVSRNGPDSGLGIRRASVFAARIGQGVALESIRSPDVRDSHLAARLIG